MEKKLVAIGGGEIGRPGTEIETLAIDQIIVKEAEGKKVLFLPTAMADDKLYQETVQKLYGDKLGEHMDYLLCCNNEITEEAIKSKIEVADIIYVGAGNTSKMLEIWKNKKVDFYLRQAYERGALICGSSAGAICWFEEAISIVTGDDGKRKATVLNGLGFIKGLICPHYNIEPERQVLLHEFINNNRDKVAIAIDNCAAIYVKGDKYEALSADGKAGVYKVYYDGEEIRELPLDAGDYNELFQ